MLKIPLLQASTEEDLLEEQKRVEPDDLKLNLSIRPPVPSVDLKLALQFKPKLLFCVGLFAGACLAASAVRESFPLAGQICVFAPLAVWLFVFTPVLWARNILLRSVFPSGYFAPLPVFFISRPIYDAKTPISAMVPKVHAGSVARLKGLVAEIERDSVEGMSSFPLLLKGFGPSYLVHGSILLAVLFPVCLLPEDTAGHSEYLLGMLLTASGFVFFAAAQFSFCTTWVPTSDTRAEFGKRLTELRARSPESWHLRRLLLDAVVWDTADKVVSDRLHRGRSSLAFLCGPTVLVVIMLIISHSAWGNFLFWVASVVGISASLFAIKGVQDLMVYQFFCLMTQCVLRMQWLTFYLEGIRDCLGLPSVPPQDADMSVLKSIIGFLSTWHEARKFIEEFDCQFLFSALSPFIGFQVVCALSALSGVIVMLFVASPLESTLYLQVAFMLLVFVSLFSIISSLWLFRLVVALADAHCTQVKVLRNLKLFIRSSGSAGDLQGKDVMLLCAYVDDLVDVLEHYRVSPVVLGIKIEPTFVNVFKSLLVAGTSSAIAKGITVLVSNYN